MPSIIQRLVDAASYSLSLDPIDEHEENDSLLMPTTDDINESLVILELPLSFRRLWNCTVLAYVCEDQPVTAITELSKL